MKLKNKKIRAIILSIFISQSIIELDAMEKIGQKVPQEDYSLTIINNYKNYLYTYSYNLDKEQIIWVYKKDIVAPRGTFSMTSKKGIAVYFLNSNGFFSIQLIPKVKIVLLTRERFSQTEEHGKDFEKELTKNTMVIIDQDGNFILKRDGITTKYILG